MFIKTNKFRTSFSAALFLFLIFASLYAKPAENKSIGDCSKKSTVLTLTDWEMKKIYFHQHDGAKVPLIPRSQLGDCIEEGKIYNLIDFGYHTHWGTVKVNNVVHLTNPIDWKSISEKIDMPVEYIKSYMKAHFGENTLTNPIALVFLGPLQARNFQNDNLVAYTTAPPNFTPVITVINNTEAKALAQNQKAVFIDVRSPQEFKSSHIPGATNVPYSITEIGTYTIYYLDPKEWDSIVNKDVFDWSKIPKKDNFVFYGWNESDPRARRTAERLIFAGYKNAKWFRNGISAWAGKTLELPDKHPYINIINITQLKEMMKKPVTLVDVGFEDVFKRPYFWHAGRIPGSINVPYTPSTPNQLDQLISLPMDQTVEKLKNDKFEFKKIPKTYPVVIYAWSHLEEKALRAAIIAKANGYNVFLFKDGTSQWNVRTRFDRINFPSEMNQIK